MYSRPTLRLLTVIRAAAWIGVALAAWSVNLRWGDDPAVGSGAPGRWERHVVGAALLCGVAALVLSVSGRGGRPPAVWAKVVALATGGGAATVVLWLRSDASSSDFGHLILGPGWTWLAVGASLALAAALACLPLRGPASRGGNKGRRAR